MPERILGYAREVHPLLEGLRAFYFRLHLIADFLAGLLFLVGSVFFLFENLVRAGTWMFVVGSLLFVAKPTIRLAHEIARSRALRQLEGDGAGGSTSATGTS
jgi:hypothetical protein